MKINVSEVGRSRQVTLKEEAGEDVFTVSFAVEDMEIGMFEKFLTEAKHTLYNQMFQKLEMKKEIKD